MKKEEKTNVMRILEQKKVPYTAHVYTDCPSPLGDREYGLHIAQSLGQDVRRVFKTLVGRGASGGYCVFVLPVAENLDLKAAARAVGEKSAELIAIKDLPAVTGYVRGGCSPIGMKKAFPTVFHASVLDLPTVFVSAGRIGTQVEVEPNALLSLLGATTAELTVKHGQ